MGKATVRVVQLSRRLVGERKKRREGVILERAVGVGREGAKGRGERGEFGACPILFASLIPFLRFFVEENREVRSS